MRRTVNRKAALILGATVVLAAGGIYFLHRYQTNRQIAIFLQRADEALAANEPLKAIEHLESYLLVNPGDLGVVVRHALLLDTTARTSAQRVRAYMALENALRGAPEGLPEVRRRAGDQALTLGRFREAKQHFQNLLTREPGNLEVKELLAQCHELLEDRTTAERLYREIIKQSPSRVKSYGALARLLEQRKKRDDANQVLKELIAANPGSAAAYLERGQFLRRVGRLEEAAQDFAAAQPLAKDDKTGAEVWLAAAELASARQQLGPAANLYATGIERFPRDARFYLGKAQLDLLGGATGRPAALDLLHRARPLVNEGSNEQLMLAKLLIDAGDANSARELCDSIRKRFGVTPVLEYLIARLRYDEGKLGEAIAIQERIRSELAKLPLLAVEADLHLAAAYGQLGNQDGQLAALDRVLRISPSVPEVLLSKAEVLSAVGKTSEAIDIYRRVVATRPGARYGLARLLIAAERQKPEEERSWIEVNDLLAKCSAEEKKSRDHVLTRLQLLWATGRSQELEQTVEQACRDNPTEMAFWLAKFAVLERRLARDDKARLAALRTCVQEATHALGDVVELRLARVRMIRGLSREQTATELAELQKGAEKFKPSDRAPLLIAVAGAYRMLGRNEDARHLLSTAAELGPAGLPALLRLAEMAVEEKRIDEVKRLAGLLRQNEGEEGVGWRMVLVDAILVGSPTDANALIDAHKLLHEVVTRRPNWYRVHTAQGRLQELERRPDALDRYVRAVEAGERNPEIIKKTVQGLLDRRRLEQLRRLMASSLNDVIDTSMYARLASVVSLATRETPAEALALAESAVRDDSTDFNDHLWLGNFRWVAGDRKGAESAFRRAVALAKTEPQAWSALLVYLVLAERKDEAAKEVSAAAEALKDRLPHALIPYYEALNQRDQAEAQYLKLLEKQPKDLSILEGLAGFYFRGANPEKAVPHLKSLIQSGDSSRAPWARRLYALLLSRTGEAAACQTALELLDQNLKGGVQNPEDLRARALVQASRPGGRHAIIADLEQAFALVRASPNEALVLAQLYEDNGQWRKAAALLRDVMSTREGEVPPVLAYFIRGLLRNGEVTQAASLLERLEAIAPQELLTVEARARVLAARGQKNEAATLLEDRTARWVADKKDPPALLTTSQILEELGAFDAAERQLKKYIATASRERPEELVLQVGFLARRGRVVEAVALCESNWDRLPLEEAASALASIVATATVPSAELGKIEARLVAAHRAKPDNLKINLALADFYQFSGRPGEAEALYRRILEKQPGHPVILNNLAWLLSERPEMLDQAIILINQAIERVGAEGSLLDTRGMIMLRRKKYSEAIGDLTEAVAQRARPQRLMHLAMAYHLSGKTLEARSTWIQAKKAGLRVAELPTSERQWFNELSRTYSRERS